eukprot:m.826902 g.826902  ORF g.826902 m.826902 type:complete len:226 (-) comp59424_c0_seq2:1560-2237(-)
MEDVVTQAQQLVCNIAEQMCSSIGILQNACTTLTVPPGGKGQGAAESGPARSAALHATIDGFATRLALTTKTLQAVVAGLPTKVASEKSASGVVGCEIGPHLVRDIQAATALARASSDSLRTATASATELQTALRQTRHLITELRCALPPEPTNTAWAQFSATLERDTNSREPSRSSTPSLHPPPSVPAPVAVSSGDRPPSHQRRQAEDEAEPTFGAKRRRTELS